MKALSATDSSRIAEALSLAELPVEEQEELLLELNSLVFEGTMIRLIERMDDATKDAFDTLLDTDPSEDAVTTFLEERVPGADQAVEETLVDIRNDILAVTGSGSD